MAAFENLRWFKRIRRALQGRFPRLWERLASWGWLVRLNTPLGEPVLLSQARRVQASRGAGAATTAPKRILFFQTRSNPPHLAWAGTMASAHRARGHDVRFLGCSRELAASCNNANYPDGLPASRCRTCYHYTRGFLGLSRFDTTWLGQYADATGAARATELIDRLPREQYREFEYAGLPLGRLVRPSVGHYLRTGSIGSDDTSQSMYRQFLINAVLVAGASARLLDEYDPDVVTMLCGLFMPEYVMLTLARQRGKRVVVYEIGMLAQDTLMFQHNHTMNYDDVDGWERYKERPLTPDQDRDLNAYLEERRAGRLSVVNYWPSVEARERVVRESLGLDPAKKTAMLFPNITWDTAMFESEVAFTSLLDWVDASVQYFIRHPEFQLVVRAHPAESILPGSQRESVADHVLERFAPLPPGIIVVPSTSPISSYTLMDMADCGLCYASSTGIELAVRGVPVLVAGRVHYRGKGFTIDVDDATTYERQLDAVMAGQQPMPRERIAEIARRYAHFIYFRTSMPFDLVHCGEGEHPVLTYASEKDLLPGRNRSLDIICDGIVAGTPFIYND